MYMYWVSSGKYINYRKYGCKDFSARSANKCIGEYRGLKIVGV